MKCDECDGEGFYYDTVKTLNGYTKKSLRSCKKCLHTGEVNWVENIFGKQPKVIFAETEEKTTHNYLVLEKENEYK